MFLTEMMRAVKGALFVVGSNTTKAGLVDQLFEVRPRYLLIDELEKMKSVDQSSLLHVMETGIISESKYNKNRHTQITCSVFAAANSCKTIIQPLLSRFLVLEIPDFTFEDFRRVALLRLKEENIDELLSDVIANKIWQEIGSKDIRDVIKVARLSHNIADVSLVINSMKRLR
jgi:Holliday junction DNA helicase RuvB